MDKGLYPLSRRCYAQLGGHLEGEEPWRRGNMGHHQSKYSACSAAAPGIGEAGDVGERGGRNEAGPQAEHFPVGEKHV